MSNETRRRSGAAFAVIVFLPLAFIALAVWWLESRFGAGVAIMVVGGLAGTFCVIIGYMLSMANSRSTLQAAAQFNADLATVERARAQTSRAELGVYREHARAEREAFSARAKLDVLDQRQIQRLAHQQAKALVDLERQKQPAARTWSTYDEEAEVEEGSFRFYE